MHTMVDGVCERSTVRRALVLTGLLLITAACSDDAASLSTEGPPPGAGPTTSSSPTAPTTTLALPTLATAAPVAAEPMVRLIAGDVLLVAERDPDSGLAYATPTVYVAAEGSAFEIRATRADYDSPVAAHLQLAGGEVALPDGSVADDWSGLTDFLVLTARDGDGNIVGSSTSSFCPNGYDKQRVLPDGPLIDPYPYGCGGNPFTLGATWGIADGWAEPVFPEAELEVPTGDYELTVSIADRYDSALGGIEPIVLALTVTDDDGIDDDGFEAGSEPLGPGFVGYDEDGFPVFDVDADGIPDDEDLFVDADGDGLDDFSQLTEAESAAAAESSAAAAEPIEPIETATPPGQAHEHSGRPAGAPTTEDSATLPDLIPLPAYGIATDIDSTTGADLLTFAADTWNAGPAPLVLDGFRQSGEADLMDGFQQFFRHGKAVGSAPIGTLEYHAGGGHDHWHFVDFSRYELLDESGELVQRSGKEAWCLASTDAIDLTVDGADWHPDNSDLSTACGDHSSLWVRESLPVGWGDTYTQDVSGQAFDISDLPNGRYLLRITANPEGNLYEVDDSNNVADRLVIIGGTPGARTVEVPAVGLVDSESGFVPIGFGGP